MRPAVAERRWQAFAQRFTPGHRYLACQASLPVSLTPDLLYYLWLNFQHSAAQPDKLLEIPWEAVADLLLSDLVEEVGQELYEMPAPIRERLLEQLENDPDLGPVRVHDLAQFLYAYAERLMRSRLARPPGLAQTLRWNALAYLRDPRAVSDLAGAYQQLKFSSRSELLRLGTLVQTLAAPVQAGPAAGDFLTLQSYAAGASAWAEGDDQGAWEAFGRAAEPGQALVVTGVRLLPPAALQRSRRVAEMGLPAAASEEALKLALEISEPQARLDAILRLVTNLFGQDPRPFTAAALEALQQVRSPDAQNAALAMLLPQLTPDQVLAAREQVGAEYSSDSAYASPYARVLVETLPHLPPPQRSSAAEEARSVIGNVKDAGQRAWLYLRLYEHLASPEPRPEWALDLLSQARRSISQEREAYGRVQLRATLMPLAPDAMRQEIVEELLKELEALSGLERVLALTTAIPYAPAEWRQDLTRQALAAVQGIGDRLSQINVLLRDVVPLLDEETRAGVLSQLAGEMQRALAGPDYPQSTLARVLPALPREAAGPLAAEALKKALAIEDHYSRVRELAALVPYLSPDVQDSALSEGLEAASRIQAEVMQASAYSLLLAYLPPERRGEAQTRALASIDKIEDPQARIQALADLSLELGQNDVQTLQNSGVLNLNQGNYPAALEAFNRALEKDPANAELLAGRGLSYQRMGQPEQALADLSRAIELDPTRGNLWMSRGEAYAQVGRNEEALQDYTRTVEIDPARAEAWAERGRILRQLRRYEEALADLDNALHLQPDSAEFRSHREAVLRDLGQVQDTPADLNQGPAVAGTVDGFGIGTALTISGNQGVVATSGINLRAQASRTAPQIGLVAGGSTVTILGAQQGEYFPVRARQQDFVDPTSVPSAANATAANPNPPPLGTCRIGLHASADPTIPEAEFKEFDDLRPDIIKVLSFHSNADVQRLARSFPSASWIVRAFQDFGSGNIGPQKFVQDTLPDVQRLTRALSGKDVVVELHNEPNVVAEGLSKSWTDGASFATWWLDVLDRYRSALPGVRFIFPGLSPGPSLPRIKLDHMQFAKACGPAIDAADGLGVHLFWSLDFPLASALHELDDYISRLQVTPVDKPIWVTEASNNKPGTPAPEKAQQYLQCWRELQSRPAVQGITFFVASANNPTLAEEVWVGRGIGALVGRRFAA